MTMLAKPSQFLRKMPALFSDMFDDDWFNLDNRWMANVPAANIKENKNEFVIELAAPGMSKKDLHIDVKDGALTISAEKKEETKKEEENYTRQEFNYQSFRRSFSLPDTVIADDIKAKYDDGVLRLTLPKKEEAKQKPAKSIQVS